MPYVNIKQRNVGPFARKIFSNATLFESSRKSFRIRQHLAMLNNSQSHIEKDHQS